ncbi:restriction endonuclease fold toxin-2 domain-containing protein [Streptomyces monticola]|uniref:Restriction endonuclease fold toxin-2 domain-containing protein n=1 Tax=Streptomyces monticola TaxID=2666263 RepID=A0ABW2JFC5_9ACTN
MANLPTAGKMLANACEAYADHIDSALQRLPAESNPLTGEPQPIWERPMFGGDGPDGGLHELLASDMHITRLGHIPPVLDTAQSRVKMPQPDGGGLLSNLPSFIAPLIRVPTMIPAAYRPPVGPRVQPVPPPTPPDPRFPTLTGPQHQNSQTWLNSLRAGDVSGGKPAEIAYQKRVAGYPEYEVPIPPGISKYSTLMVYGFRDGMAIKAKYVNNPEKKCYRSLDELRENHQSGKKDFLYDKGRKELAKYSAALNDPRNTEMRGVETVTNNNDSVAYWRITMAAYGVRATHATCPNPVPTERGTMEADQIAELRTMYVFGPAEGETWGLTFAALERKLRECNPDEFIRVEEAGDGPLDSGTTMHFGITLDDEDLEGMAKLDSEGVSITDCTAPLAAEFAVWLRQNVVPDGTALTFNTEWGLEEDLPDALVPDATQEELASLFVARIEETGGLD